MNEDVYRRMSFVLKIILMVISLVYSLVIIKKKQKYILAGFFMFIMTVVMSAIFIYSVRKQLELKGDLVLFACAVILISLSFNTVNAIKNDKKTDKYLSMAGIVVSVVVAFFSVYYFRSMDAGWNVPTL